MLKFICFVLVAVGVAQAYDSPAITSQQQNILRSYGNLGQVSTYSKSIDTPFSSVRKADIRVSNPGLTFASPLGHAGYATPLAHSAYGGPLTHAAYGGPLAPAYSTPLAHAYSAPYVSHLAGGPIVAPVAKAVAAPGGLLGVAYSAAPAVAHMTYSNGLGVSYAW